MSITRSTEYEDSTKRSCPTALPVVAMDSRATPTPGPNSGPGARSQGRLKAVPNIELQMGDLPPELAAPLGRCQAVIDVARAEACAADGAPLELTWEEGRFLVPDGFAGAVLWNPTTSASAEVVVVEGAEAALAATAFAADDVVVAGAVEGFGEMDWTTLAPLVAGRPVILLPARDLTQDWRAFDAVDRAIKSLEIVGAKQVRIATDATGKGLVGLLTSTMADPTNVLSNLIRNAVAFRKNMKPSGPRPARAMVTHEDGEDVLGDFVSSHLGQIVQISPPQFMELDGKRVLVSKPEHLAGKVDGRNVYATRTLLEAAVSVVSATEVLDDLAYPPSPPKMRYQLDVQVGAGDGAGHYPIEVDDADLVQPTVWRARLGAAGAAVTLGRAGMGPIGGQRIGEAIRKTITPGTPVIRRVLRTGWVTIGGSALWCDRTGGHGLDEKTSAVAADLRTITAGVDIPGADTFSIGEIQESVREVIRAADQFVDPTMWIAGVAATYRAVSGADREAVLWAFGKPGAGKSFTVSVLASQLGVTFGPGREQPPPDATLASFRAMAYEAHEVPLFFDDARPISDRMGGGDQMVTLDTSVRVGYADAAQIKMKMEPSGGTQWQSAPIRRTRPFVIITGEDPPPARDPGTVERCLVLRVGYDTSLRKGAKEELEKLCGRQAFQPALAGYLRRRAQVITEEHGGDLDMARRAITTETKDLVAPWIAARPKLSGLTSRVRGTAHTFAGGALTFLNWAADYGAITFPERDQLVEEWVGLLLDAVEASAETYLEGVTVADQILDTVKGLLASGRYCIGWSSNPSDTVLGQIVTVDGKQHVALIPSMVEKIARDLGLAASVSIPAKMADVVVPTLDKKGNVKRTTRQVRMDRAQIWAYVIRPEKMVPAEYDPNKSTPQADLPEPESEPEPEPETPTTVRKPRQPAPVPTRQAKAKTRRVPA